MHIREGGIGSHARVGMEGRTRLRVCAFCTFHRASDGAGGRHRGTCVLFSPGLVCSSLRWSSAAMRTLASWDRVSVRVLKTA